MSLDTPEHSDVPGDWDRIRGDVASITGGLEHGAAAEPAHPQVLAVVAAAWADLVAVLAVCAIALATVVGFGYGTSLPALPWTAALAVTWWGAAAVPLVVVRRGTPGMLVAGVVFDRAVPPARIPLVLAVALLVAVALGVPAALGATRSPLGAAAGARLTLPAAATGEEL